MNQSHHNSFARAAESNFTMELSFENILEMPAKEEMSWEPVGFRWRRNYEGVKIKAISAKKLLKDAGIIADHRIKENTRVLANKYFEKEKIDAAKSLKKFNPNHSEYVVHRDSMKQLLEVLLATKDKEKAPIIADIKNRIFTIEKLITESTVNQKPLPPIPFSLQHPLSITENKIDDLAKMKRLNKFLENWKMIIFPIEMFQTG